MEASAMTYREKYLWNLTKPCGVLRRCLLTIGMLIRYESIHRKKIEPQSIFRYKKVGGTDQNLSWSIKFLQTKDQQPESHEARNQQGASYFNDITETKQVDFFCCLEFLGRAGGSSTPEARLHAAVVDDFTVAVRVLALTSKQQQTEL